MSSLPLKINATEFATIMTSRTGIDLHAETPATGIIAVLRASDLEAPNGFTINITTTWRTIEASFRPDNYAGALIKHMSGSDAITRVRFNAVMQSFLSAEMRIKLKINGHSIPDFSNLPVEPWSSLDLCISKFSDPEAGDTVLDETSREVCGACISALLVLINPEDAATSNNLYECGLPEGAKLQVTVNRYERSPANRAACIAIFGAKCWVCGLDFHHSYGDLGSGFIEVHHKTKVSEIGSNYAVNPATDLIPLCSNCHSMVHRVDPPMKVEDLKAVYKLRTPKDN